MVYSTLDNVLLVVLNAPVCFDLAYCNRAFLAWIHKRQTISRGANRACSGHARCGSCHVDNGDFQNCPKFRESKNLALRTIPPSITIPLASIPFNDNGCSRRRRTSLQARVVAFLLEQSLRKEAVSTNKPISIEVIPEDLTALTSSCRSVKRGNNSMLSTKLSRMMTQEDDAKD
ncbi:hypothetical protein Ae201684P_007172 [Aphanomyces euteiches]|nr:hypothetical protein Ae201684P_007172 [Aphanomyces euteiches]